MDILKSIVGDKTMGVLVSGLIGRGFTRDQAERFLPEAGGHVISAIKTENSDTDVDSIIGTMDVERMASTIGIDSSMISNGLQYIIPGLMDQVGGSDMSSHLGGSDMSSHLGKVKSFF